MHVSLTSRLEKFVHGKVSSGLYNNASEVVREALRLLREQDQEKLQRLRRALVEGEKSGPAENFDFDDFMNGLEDEEQAGP